MPATVITNATLLDLDPLEVRAGSIRVSDGVIESVGPHVTVEPGNTVIDAGGAVVMPGLVNGHTHLYSALAAGMPAPPKTPTNFHEILQYVWWRLDRALDLPLVEMSGAIGGLDALHCGTTTLIDHHASPSAIDGSLDAIEAGLRTAGVRGVLCYEVTDRNGLTGRDAGLCENERYLEKVGHAAPRHFAALVGAHAAFTMNDESLAACTDIAKRFHTGVHIHVAEDPCDARICRETYRADLLDRLDRAGILDTPSILGHGTHLTPEDLTRINASPVGAAHNTRSNMNNAVGYALLAAIQRPIQLGTDGIGSDMFTEVQTAWFKYRDSHSPASVQNPAGGRSLGPTDFIAMLVNSARRASDLLGVTLGRLTPGAAADLVVTDYLPATPLSSANAAGHLLFAMSARHVRHVMVAGEWKLRDRVAVDVDEARIRSIARTETQRLWQRMADLPV